MDVTVTVTGDMLRERRLAAGKTQQEVARLTKYSQAHISQVESKGRPFTDAFAQRYMDALNDIETSAPVEHPDNLAATRVSITDPMRAALIEYAKSHDITAQDALEQIVWARIA